MRKTIFNLVQESQASGINSVKNNASNDPAQIKGDGKQEISEQQKQEQAEKALVVSGPLSEVYTKALDIVFSKDEEIRNKLVLESQAIDAIVNAAVAASTRINDEELEMKVTTDDNGVDVNANTFVHVTDAKNFNEKQIQAIAGQSAVMQENAPQTQYVLVIDGATNPFSSPKQKMQEIETAVAVETLSIAKKVLAKNNVKVCFGFEHFIDTLVKSQKNQ